jgi:hypothetical protein
MEPVKHRPKRKRYLGMTAGQLATIAAMSVFICVVFGVAIALLLDNPGQSSQVSQKISPTAEPTKTPRKPTPIPYPILKSLRDYPWVNELDLIKRSSYYKNESICLDEMRVFNVLEDQGTTVFMIQSENGSYPVVGTVYYDGTIPDLLDDFNIIIGGYVIGTESELNISSSSRPVILMQRYHWFSSNNQFHDFTNGDGDIEKCKYMEPEILLGHWRSESGRTDYYIDQNTLIMVSDGERSVLKYSILETNNRENSISIRTLSDKSGYKVGHDKILVFAPDRKSFAETVIALGTEVDGGIMKYIDSKRKP